MIDKAATTQPSKSKSIMGLFVSMVLISACAGFGPEYSADTKHVPRALELAGDGHLAMLYDSRMHPAAIEHDGKLILTWRGQNGWPQVRIYDLATRELSEQVNVYDGLEQAFDLEKYTKDQHYNPVIWLDRENHLHLIAGCHGNWLAIHNDCDKVKSKIPGDIFSGWELVDETIAESINYPKVYPIYEDQTLMHFRHSGHIGAWTYRISENGTDSWHGPDQPIVDMNSGASPFEDCLDFFSGSYHNIRIGEDGKTLHNAFVWQQDFIIKMLPEAHQGADCEPPPNTRYGFQGDEKIDTRYNLYYVKVDLPTGKVFNHAGEELSVPISRRVADRKALIWDTDERIFAAPPSIWVDEEEEPYFLGMVSEDTPHRGWFTFVRHDGNEWQKTKVAKSSHYYNSALLDRAPNGDFRAFLIIGEEDTSKQNRRDNKLDLNNYGWGERVEEWVSQDEGRTWRMMRDITPIKGLRYQNLKRASGGIGQSIEDIVLFYGWAPDANPGEATIAQ